MKKDAAPSSCTDDSSGCDYIGAIVLVSKCPTKGKSKTRLIPLLGEEGSASLAKAMLSDVLLTLSNCTALDSILKILLYAPGSQEGYQGMVKILDELTIEYDSWNANQGPLSTVAHTRSKDKWLLMPMESKVDLQSSDLGDLLEHALDRAREQLQDRNGGQEGGSVVFVGMDSPVLPLDDIHSAFYNNTTSALLCPADDGGYGMLSVPSNAKAAKTFGGVCWSQTLTAVSQLKALTDQGISVRIGTLMHDIDEPEDVQQLCNRLRLPDPKSNTPGKPMVLDRPSGWLLTSEEVSDSRPVTSTHEPCSYTREALKRAGIL